VPDASTGPRAIAAPALQRAAGAAFLGLGTLMSLLLVLEHFGGLSLPGCGEGGGCEQALDSVWASVRVGGFEWPVSFLGLAYFLSAFVTWIAARGGLPQTFRYLVRLAALGSLGFCVILVLERTFCPYCIAAHIGNFAFWITMESVRIPLSRPRLTVISAVTLFVLVTAALGTMDVQHRAAVRRKAETERGAATELIIGQSREQRPSPAEPGLSETDDPLFTGRYLIGSAEAPIRIVMFTDYQCQDCYNIERQLKELHATRSDISISIKHFPFNSDCNPHVTRSMHSNACWAARAAEAAGMLWGHEGFWRMHAWLFDRRGVFETTAELEDGIREMGYDPTGFTHVMSHEKTLKAVRADAAEAKRLGLYFVPMIFINGVELKGWTAPNALIRTVEQVAATNPPARSAALDRPPLAPEKYVADWREQPQISLPRNAQEWTLGPEDADIEVVMWGDYQESGTRAANAIILAFAAGRSDVGYTYRHFPFNSDCNPGLKERRHPDACQAALAAEAAGRLGGNEGYWKMHAWLMENQQPFNDEALRRAAVDMGIDDGALFSAMTEDGLQANILDDIRAGDRLPKLRHGMPPGIYGVPTIFVNGRFVPRWRLDDRPVLNDILSEAARYRDLRR
jgi:predicted DsbA family dithiol-disulfide isomerase/uncharacterized membrane protein